MAHYGNDHFLAPRSAGTLLELDVDEMIQDSVDDYRLVVSYQIRVSWPRTCRTSLSSPHKVASMIIQKNRVPSRTFTTLSV